MPKDNLAKNIKALRKAFGETGEQLGLALGLAGGSAISNYENGLREPDRDIIKKICRHYKVTEEDLLYLDFERLSFQKINFDNKEKLKTSFLRILPIVCSEEALKDLKFKDAYLKHLDFAEDLQSGNTPDSFEPEDCIDQYEYSFFKNHTVEAAANLIWWILFIQLMVKSIPHIDKARKFLKNEISGTEFIRQLYLVDCDVEETDETTEESIDLDPEIEMEFMDCLEALYFSEKYHELADYYLALGYHYGIISNHYSVEQNIALAEAMIQSFALLGNKYALDFLSLSWTENE